MLCIRYGQPGQANAQQLSNTFYSMHRQVVPLAAVSMPVRERSCCLTVIYALHCREVSRRVIVSTGIASTILAGSKNAGALTPIDIVKRQGEVSSCRLGVQGKIKGTVMLMMHTAVGGSGARSRVARQERKASSKAAEPAVHACIIGGSHHTVAAVVRLYDRRTRPYGVWWHPELC